MRSNPYSKGHWFNKELCLTVTLSKKRKRDDKLLLGQ